MLDVGEQRSNARILLDRLIAALDQSGLSKLEETVGDTKLLIYEGLGDDGDNRLILLEKDDTIVAGSDAGVTNGASRIAASSKRPTSRNMRTCSST